jgi:HK97 family phage prohead protease
MKEVRTFNCELRAEGDEKRTVKGIAAVFNSRTELWTNTFEEISPSAFDESLADDVRALFNNDANLILGRTKAGTLKISKSADGLEYEFTAPDTTAGNDLIENLRLGNIDQSSFAFSVEKSSWTDLGDGKWLRTIEKVKRLYDVSPVTYPAYEDTKVALREFEKRNGEIEAEKLEAEKQKHAKDLFEIDAKILELQYKENAC